MIERNRRCDVLTFETCWSNTLSHVPSRLLYLGTFWAVSGGLFLDLTVAEAKKHKPKTRYILETSYSPSIMHGLSFVSFLVPLSLIHRSNLRSSETGKERRVGLEEQPRRTPHEYGNGFLLCLRSPSIPIILGSVRLYLPAYVLGRKRREKRVGEAGSPSPIFIH